MRKVFRVILCLVLFASGCTRRGETQQEITFPQKVFFDSAQHAGEGSVYISGTLTGDGVSYKNNSVAVTCYKDRMECLSTFIAEIGPKQVGRIESPEFYSVIKWDADMVVATCFVDIGHCRKTTISIVRKSGIASWVEEPVNQSSASCKDADTRLLKWTIEDSLYWKDRKK